MFPDGTFRFHAHGEDFGGLCMFGTFSQYAVVSEFSVIPVPKEYLSTLPRLWPQLPTGWGSAVRAAACGRPDRRHLRSGGVGSDAVQGASLAGAKN